MIIPVNLSDEEIEKLLNKDSGENTRVSEQAIKQIQEGPLPKSPDQSEQGQIRPVRADEQPNVLYWGNLFFFDFPIVRRDGINFTFHAVVTKESIEDLKAMMRNSLSDIVQSYVSVGITNLDQMSVNLFIDSGGGSIPDGFDLIDFLAKYPIPVTTIGTGTVASMAVPILLAGKKRLVTPNTHLLIHQFRAGVSGKRQDILDMLQHLEKVHEQLINYISSKTKLAKKDVDEMMKSETWLTTDDAMKYGIVDDIY